MNDVAMGQGADRAQIEALVRAEHGDPFAFLGPHQDDQGPVIRAYLPGALGVELLDGDSSQSMGRLVESATPGLFIARPERLHRYRLRIHWGEGFQETEDPYSFGPLLGETDLYLFAEGNHRELGKVFGAQLTGHAVIPCACATRPGSGNCSCRACRRARCTSTSCSASTACCR